MPSNLASSFKNPGLPPTLPCFFQVPCKRTGYPAREPLKESSTVPSL